MLGRGLSRTPQAHLWTPRAASPTLGEAKPCQGKGPGTPARLGFPICETGKVKARCRGGWRLSKCQPSTLLGSILWSFPRNAGLQVAPFL